MKDGNHLVDQSVRDIAASSKTSPTAAGPTDQQARSDALVETINQVFTLFRINYHNQYHAAFGDVTVLNQAKRLWKEALAPYGNDHILRAARRVIEQSEYLPTLHKMLSACENSLTDLGLPTVRDAYLEAANAPSPKNVQHWSHPAVYLAGREMGWHNLSHLPEARSWPLFVDAYREQIKKVLAGDTLEIDAPPQLEQQRSPALPREEGSERLRQLKKLLAK